MGRPLLFGLDGRTPIAYDGDVSEDVVAVLVEAFAHVTGILVAQAQTATQVEMLMNESRQKIIQGVLKTDGCQKAIEERFKIGIGYTKEGELVMTTDEEMARPPGAPRGPQDIYR